MMERTNKDLETIHNEELSIAKFFANFCEQHQLKYMMLGGTMLGAIRHQGFIPWDDDMDFGMPRQDYETLVTLLQQEKNLPYQFKNYNLHNIKTYFSRLESDRYTLVDKSANTIDERGPWIDIFPIDYISNPESKSFPLLKLKLLYRRLMFQYSQFDTLVNQNLPGRKGIEKWLIQVGNVIHPERFLNTQHCLNKLDQSLKKMNQKPSNYMINFMGIYKFNEMFKKEIYEDLVLYPFEDIQLKGPKDYHSYLTQLYGDYMQLPPVEEQNKHHIYLKKEEQ